MESVAKKYIKALSESFSTKELEEIIPLFTKLSKVLAEKKVADLLYSPFMKSAQKEGLLLSVFDTIDKRFENFLKLLVLENRIELLPSITEGLEKRLLAQKKQFVAILHTKDGLDSKTQELIAKSLSKKLNAELSIRQEQASIDGIKLSVEDLGIEISFSKERFLQDLSAHILKAI
ncbi:F0F1 ATP synthase subunit delta [Helicobacter himalayensis]|uniref:F0F1 ATP synthase subunit delta n=1 Tax=Helicobacter himalayensis TaxID=1591088 RepID=UPI00082F4A37|nr:F0F1 ATP synthase subunit delta [Helicobacter himalayensis]